METEKVKKQFEKITKNAFDDYVQYGFFAGSFVYRSIGALVGNSDIDVLIVLSDSILQDTNELRKRRVEFNKGYLEIHKSLSCKPDLFFPGEIISYSMLEDLKLGKGFDAHQTGDLRYRVILGDDQEWIEDPSLEFRCWRSMHFFTNENMQFIGSEEKFRNSRRKVLIPFLYFLGMPTEKGMCSYEDYLSYLRTRIEGSQKDDFGYIEAYSPRLWDEIYQGNIPIQSIFEELGILDNNLGVSIDTFNEKKKKFVERFKNTQFQNSKNPFIVERW